MQEVTRALCVANRVFRALGRHFARRAVNLVDPTGSVRSARVSRGRISNNSLGHVLSVLQASHKKREPGCRRVSPVEQEHFPCVVRVCVRTVKQTQNRWRIGLLADAELGL